MEARDSDPPPCATAAALSPSQAQLYDEALTRFGATCLWNAAPSKSLPGLQAVAEHLRDHGGMEAWRLAARIRTELGLATR